MTRAICSALFLGVALGGVVRAQPLEGLASDAVVARVGDRVVTAGELLRETVHRYGVRTIADIVAERLLEARCAQAGIAVAESEIDRALAQLRSDLGDEGYATHLAACGGEGSLRQRMRHERMFELLVGPQAEPSEGELQELYGQQVERFRLPLISASGILVADEADAQALVDGAVTPANFAAMARDISVHPSAADGGQLGVVDPLTWSDSPAVFAALATADEGAIVGPIATPSGWWVLLRGADAGERMAGFAEVRDALREEARAAKLAALKARWRTEVRRGVTVFVFAGPLFALAGGPPPPVVPSAAGSGAGGP